MEDEGLVAPIEGVLHRLLDLVVLRTQPDERAHVGGYGRLALAPRLHVGLERGHPRVASDGCEGLGIGVADRHLDLRELVPRILDEAAGKLEFDVGDQAEQGRLAQLGARGVTLEQLAHVLAQLFEAVVGAAQVAAHDDEQLELGQGGAHLLEVDAVVRTSVATDEGGRIILGLGGTPSGEREQ